MDRFDVKLANALNLATPNPQVKPIPKTGLLATLEQIRASKKVETKGENDEREAKVKPDAQKQTSSHDLENKYMSAIKPKNPSSIRFRC